MKCTMEKFRAYAVLVFLILFACILLGDSRHTDTVQHNVEIGEWPEMTAIGYEGITVTARPILKSQSTRMNVNIIIMVISLNLMLFLYLSGSISINIYGRCMIPVWRVVLYIHNSDGEKGADIVTA